MQSSNQGTMRLINDNIQRLFASCQKCKVCSLYILTVICSMFMLLSCSDKSKQEDSDFHSPRPLVSVFFIPCNGVTAKEVKAIANDFASHFASKQGERYVVNILPSSVLAEECLNDAKSRYRASKVIDYLNSLYLKDAIRKTDSIVGEESGSSSTYLIGVTNKDISTSIHNKPDYGILGLSYLNGTCSIISTYRMKRKSDMWKLAAHEFCHGFFGCPHCKGDDPHCLMQDAKGGNPHFELKDSLCTVCGAICVID